MNNTPSSDYGEASWFERKIIKEGYRKVGAYYGYASNGYQRFRHKYLVQLLQQGLGDDTPDSVLDVGCGVGNFVNLVAETFSPHCVLGVDFVEPVVAAAREQFPHIEFRQDNLPELAGISEKFDLIIVSEVLYYLNAEEQQEAIARLAALLTTGGRVLVSSTLASNTFATADDLCRLVQSQFEIQAMWIQNSRLYLKLMQPFILSHKVETTQPSADWSPMHQRIYRLFQTPVIGRILLRLNGMVKRISSPILRSPGLAAFFTDVGALLGTRYAGSNVILLLKKRG